MSKEELKRELLKLTLLKEDWDDEGGMPINKECAEVCNNFIDKYLSDIDADTTITPGPEMSVDIVIRGAEYETLINISSDRVGYYGDNYTAKETSKGMKLEEWLKKYKTEP